MLTKERLQELFRFDEKTGEFIRISRRRGGKGLGSVAGRVNADGRRTICVDRVEYLAYRLVWLWSTGALPDREIDHINGDPSDNRLCNLRLATRRENEANKPVRKDSRTGVKGVTRKGKKFAASTRVNGKRTHLGTFDTIEAAAATYAKATVELYGEFARLS